MRRNTGLGRLSASVFHLLEMPASARKGISGRHSSVGLVRSWMRLIGRDLKFLFVGRDQSNEAVLSLAAAKNDHRLTGQVLLGESSFHVRHSLIVDVGSAFFDGSTCFRFAAA